MNWSHPQLFRYLGKKPFETHSKNLPHVSILKIFKFLFEKTHLIFQKNPKFDRFENSVPIEFYAKSATIKWKSKATFRREQICRCWFERHCQTSGKKRTFREEDFAFINSLQNMTQKTQKFPQKWNENLPRKSKKGPFRLESVKWRAASRKCHHTKGFR